MVKLRLAIFQVQKMHFLLLLEKFLVLVKLFWKLSKRSFIISNILQLRIVLFQNLQYNVAFINQAYEKTSTFKENMNINKHNVCNLHFCKAKYTANSKIVSYFLRVWIFLQQYCNFASLTNCFLSKIIN